jgi:signal transduction histidine kinase/ligand-binding sensor domain-containing protein/AraC-like DNA-binding protein/CheY-like chemotaxis protein
LSSIKHFILFFFCINAITCFAQNSFDVLQLENDYNNSQSIIYSVAQDSVGNLWMATEEGVLKNNSLNYQKYNTYNGLENFSKNRITKIIVDSEENIWIGHENGIGLYNKQLDVFENLITKANNAISGVKSITEDSNQHIWVGAYNGLFKIKRQKDTFSVSKILDNYSINAVFVKDDLVYLGTDKGLVTYSTTSKSVKIISGAFNSPVFFINELKNHLYIGFKNGNLFKLKNNEFKKVELPVANTSPIYDIVQDKSNNIYIATDGNGIIQLNRKNELITHFLEDVNNPKALTSNGVYDIELGKENIIWIATYGGGINYIDLKQRQFEQITHKINDDNSIASNFTRAIATDANKNIWFGTKQGISIFNPNKNEWKHLTSFKYQNTSVNDIVLALQPDANFMYVGTYNSGVFKVNINSLVSESVNYKYLEDDILQKVYAIHKDQAGNLWIGGIEGELTVIKTDNSIRKYNTGTVRYITQTKDGLIYVAGRLGLFAINADKNEVNKISEIAPNVSNLAYTTINVIYEDQNNNLLLGTNGEGLIIYNPKSKLFKKIKMQDGLPSDIIQGFLAETHNNYWVSTTKGLANVKFNIKDTLITNYDKNDGLASTEFNYGSFKKLAANKMAFGGIDGVTIFNPKKIKEFNYTPDIVFTNIKLFNKNLDPNSEVLEHHINETEEIKLNHKENSIQFEFTGVSHSINSKLKYTYQLEGFSNQWSIPSEANLATYTNLNSGSYTFKVKSVNKYGNFGKERIINISISTPFWKSNLAYFLYAITFILLIFSGLYFARFLINKRNAEEQIEFFNNITHEIKTPLTILISSLDNITDKSSSNEESKTRIKTTVKRINSLFEQLLNFHKITSQENISNHISEIDVKTHIEQVINDFEPLTSEKNISISYQNEWQDGFFINDKDLLDKVLLNIISNAIKYSNIDGQIDIKSLKNANGDLELEIKDDGIGIPKDQQKYILKRYYRARNVINSQRPGTGLGLVMVKRILEKSGGSIKFKSEENKGTTFNISLKNLKQELKDKQNIKTEIVQSFVSNHADIDGIDSFSDNQILIVEDNDELRELLVNTLGEYFQVHEAKNGKEGLEKASVIFPNLILTDLIMPEMDGMQMSKHIKDDINLNHIPVFMLTVLQNSSQKIESIKTGISEYIEKPIDLNFLLFKIVNTFKWQQTLRQKYVHDNESNNAELFKNNKDKEFLDDLEQTVIDNIENNSFSVHDLSKSFGMSRTSLYMKLKNLVNLSPQDFIIHTKLKHAKSLLIKGDLSIKEVAYRSGFSNPKYFSTSFKKIYNITPSQYINSLKK